MSQFAPVAPPPPPPKRLSLGVVEKRDNSNIVSLLNDECRWALEHPDVQKGCYFSRVCQYTEPKNCQYNDIPSLLQVGPTCGLTALSMLLNEQPTAAELLLDAIAQKYTINGEMFSAEYLYKLTRKHFTDEDECQFYKGILNSDIVKEQLIAGKCLLVPYPFQNLIISLI